MHNAYALTKVDNLAQAKTKKWAVKSTIQYRMYLHTYIFKRKWVLMTSSHKVLS